MKIGDCTSNIEIIALSTAKELDRHRVRQNTAFIFGSKINDIRRPWTTEM